MGRNTFYFHYDKVLLADSLRREGHKPTVELRNRTVNLFFYFLFTVFFYITFFRIINEFIATKQQYLVRYCSLLDAYLSHLEITSSVDR